FKNFEAARVWSNNNAVSKDIVNISSTKTKEKTNLPVLCTTVLGTLASLLFIRKYKGMSIKNDLMKLSRSSDIKTNLKNIANFFDINISLKEMLIMGTGSILGGLAGGIITDKNKKTKNKVKEGVYQYFNMAVPTFIVDRLIKLTKKHEKFNNRFAQIGSVVVGIGGGMPIASMISQKINNSIVDKEPKYNRKMKLKDCIMHIDDITMALILAKVPFVSKLGIDKILPILYLPSGYETGKQK
ncbi:MAG TPA: hypothetical protein DDW90_05905, partial [Cyanobacteria bacterium UBA9971]|nr:hypothetical protein [Cyanobacteria bacterium UBA9971]